MNMENILRKIIFSFYVIFFIIGIYGLLSCVPIHKSAKRGVAKETRLLDKKANEIISLNTKIGDEGEIIVSIKASDSFHYTAFKGSDPLRLVLDFPNTKKGRFSDVINVGEGVVDNIRTLYSQDEHTLRLEIFLNQGARYHIRKIRGDEIAIQLYEVATQPAQVEETQAQVSLKEVEAPSPEKVVEQKPIIPVDPCESLLGRKKDRIDLDFQNASLPNTLRVFSEMSGLNIVIAEEVKGNINLRLQNVPWNQAFQIILANNRLRIQCIGDNIVNVTRPSDIRDESVARNVVNENQIPEKILRPAMKI